MLQGNRRVRSRRPRLQGGRRPPFPSFGLQMEDDLQLLQGVERKRPLMGGVRARMVRPQVEPSAGVRQVRSSVFNEGQQRGQRAAARKRAQADVDTQRGNPRLRHSDGMVGREPPRRAVPEGVH